MADKRIKDLNTFAGTPGTSDWLAIDSANETKKINRKGLLPIINLTETITVNEEVVANPSSVTATRIADLIIISLNGAEFKPGIGRGGITIASGVPNRYQSVAAPIMHTLGSADRIQGIMLVNQNNILTARLNDDYMANTKLYGEIVYLTSQ